MCSADRLCQGEEEKFGVVEEAVKVEGRRVNEEDAKDAEMLQQFEDYPVPEVSEQQLELERQRSVGGCAGRYGVDIVLRW